MTRILIVDDEVAILNALGRLLRRTPCVLGDEVFKLIVDGFCNPPGDTQHGGIDFGFFQRANQCF